MRTSLPCWLKKTDMFPAVFLDRDGTVVEDRGYLRSQDEVVFFDRTVPALRKLQRYFSLFIVTNQGGIARGLQEPEEVERINLFIENHLRENGIRVLKTYTCSHRREDGCRCIKPNPFFARRAAEEFSISLPNSYAVGDHPHDAEFGNNFGGCGIYVLSGHGRKHLAEIDGDFPVVSDIGQAADWILEKSKRFKCDG